MTLRERFEQYDPQAFFLDAADLEGLDAYLKANTWLRADDRVLSAERAGAGNMNYVLRVKTEQRSVIVKQSRPWVEKFPHIDAPGERAIIEGQFYQLIQLNKSLRKYTPKIYGFDELSGIIILEDLGPASDFNAIYQKGNNLTEQELQELLKIMTLLHSSYNTDTTKERIFNRSMRKLNHEHLFVFPLMEDNGFNLDTVQGGLQGLAMSFKTDPHFKKRVLELGELYLEDGEYLLHGDFYPGSWLRTEEGPKLIDPEFCFFGPREFDLAVLFAHLKMAQQPEKYIQHVIDNYALKTSLSPVVLCNFTGIEIMRRIIGLAQLPLHLTIEERADLLEQAYELIMDPRHCDLFAMLVKKG